MEKKSAAEMSSPGGMDEWIDGWMDGWVDGGSEVKASLRIAYSNQNNN